jgi:hypothetical protein
MIVGMPGRGLLHVLMPTLRPRMASHDVSWTLGVHARLGSLDYLTTVEEGLAQAPALV